MTNVEASDVLREYIRTNSPCNGLEMALRKAITALEHAPEMPPCDYENWVFHEVTWDKQRDMYVCLATQCGQTFSNLKEARDHERATPVSEIGRKA